MPLEPFDFTYNLINQDSQNDFANLIGKSRVKEFEPKSYFFTESTVAAQTSNDGSYGPDNETSTTKFNITTQFNLADKKAYAVTSGQVLIVPQDGAGNESKVNVFIKPLKNIDIGVQVKYFVYRGLKKELFIDENDNILGYSSSSLTPFMSKVWLDLINFNDLTTPPPSGITISSSLFGYSTTEPSTKKINEKFFNLYSDQETDSNLIYNLPIVEAGQYFGDFKDNQGGFEIILNEGFYNQEKSDTDFEFNMNYAKAKKIVLDVDSIANDPTISEKNYRENVQNFLDPAAFYGAHINESESGEIKVVDNSARYSTKSEIFTNILSKFFNKYKLYLYIQNNRGRSFNFDTSHGIAPIIIEDGISNTPISYESKNWPILIFEVEQTYPNDAAENQIKFNDFSFQIKFKTLDKNVSLYNTHGKCSNENIKGNFLTKDALVDNDNLPTQEFSKKISFKLLNTSSISSSSTFTFKNVASFIYLNHYEKEIEYFNDFFGPVKIYSLSKPSNGFSLNNAKKASGTKKKIIKSRDGKLSINNQIFTLLPQNQLPIDDNPFRLYILKKIGSDDSNDRSFAEFNSNDFVYKDLTKNDDYGQFQYGSKNFKVWKGTIIDGTEHIRTLQLVNLEENGNVTDFMQLGIMEVDFKKVIYDSLTNSDTNHIPESNANIYFHLDPINSSSNSVYKKYKLGVKVETFDLFLGFSYDIKYPSLVNETYVYTIDGYYFFTKEFAEKFHFTEEFSNSEINFSTYSGYNGGFGFDWMRLSENNNFGYQDSIKNGYAEPEWYLNDFFIPQKRYGFEEPVVENAFQNLRKEYINLATQQNSIYYVPYLNIYSYNAASELNGIFPNDEPPAFEVHLKATITIHENLTNLIIDFDTNLFSISCDLPTNLNIGSNSDFDLRIFCDKEFATDQYIKFYASSITSDGFSKAKLAGIIKVCKNSLINRERIKIVLFNTITDVDNNTIPETASYSNDEIQTLKNVLYQAYIYADIEGPLDLNLMNDPKFKLSSDYVDSNGKIFAEYPMGGIEDEKQDYLKAKVDAKYNNYLRVYAFKNGTTTDGSGTTEGNVQKIGKHSICLYGGNSPRDKFSLAHEVCHALSLRHSHADGDNIEDPNQKYIFHYGGVGASESDVLKSTDNIMSYNVLKKTVWNWQSKIMRANIKNYSDDL